MSTEREQPNGRFKPGQSGNPRGRPRRDPAITLRLDDQATKAQLLKEARRKIPIRDGEKRSMITTREAVIRSQVTGALKGSAYSQRFLIEGWQRADQEQAIEIAKDNECWERYCTLQRAKLDAATQAGERLPAVYPHPDDVIIRRGRPVTFTGPMDEEDARKVDRSCRFRDALLMQDALDRKLVGTQQSQTNDPGGALLLAVAIDRALPARLRLSHSVLVTRMALYDGTNRRDLLKSVFQTWRGLGLRNRRGWTFPSRREIAKWLKWSVTLREQLDSGELDPEAFLRGAQPLAPFG